MTDPMDFVPDDVKLRLDQMAAGLQRLAACVSRRKIHSFIVERVSPCPPEDHDTGVLVTLPDGGKIGCVLGESEHHLELLNDLVGKCVNLPIDDADGQ